MRSSTPPPLCWPHYDRKVKAFVPIADLIKLSGHEVGPPRSHPPRWKRSGRQRRLEARGRGLTVGIPLTRGKGSNTGSLATRGGQRPGWRAGCRGCLAALQMACGGSAPNNTWRSARPTQNPQASPIDRIGMEVCRISWRARASRRPR